MIDLIIGIIIILLAGVFQGESENILMWQFSKNWEPKPFLYYKMKNKNFYKKWYLRNNWDCKKIFSQGKWFKFLCFLWKYPFAAFKDGFHATKTVAILLFILGLSFLHFSVIEQIVIAYIIFGVGFDVGYHT